MVKQCSAKSILKVCIIKVSDITPKAIIAVAALGDQTVDVGIPFEIPAKGMKYTDKARSKEFGFVIFMEHMCNNTINSREKTVQKRAVI